MQQRGQCFCCAAMMSGCGFTNFYNCPQLKELVQLSLSETRRYNGSASVKNL